VIDRDGRAQRCAVCGYSKTVQVCHRSGIGESDSSALIAEINDPRNLVLLCPNHHWEMDHGCLDVPLSE
jgi:hypothetical protein